MTDAELDEIEKRNTAARNHPLVVTHALMDVPALIAEVRRLKGKLRSISDYHILGVYCDRCGYGNRGDE